MTGKIKRGDKITDPKRLEVLAKARAKALETRRKKSEEKKKIKLAEDLERQRKLENADKVLGIKEDKKENVKIKVKEPKPEPEPEPEVESDTPEIEYRKKPKRKKKKIVYVESSESEEEEIVRVPRRKKKVEEEPVQKPPQQPAYQTPVYLPQPTQEDLARINREKSLANLMAKTKGAFKNVI